MSVAEASPPLLEVRNLARSFRLARPWPWAPAAEVRAVDGVSFDLRAGETLGLVGESGCGKSTTGRLILDLLAPDGGEVLIDGDSVRHLSARDGRGLRRKAQIIFQDAASALNPRLPVGAQIREPLDIHGIGAPETREAAALRMLQAVGLQADMAGRYPHELSGGQQQRVVIARALILEPKLVVCDEPVSALDVSVQAQVVNLLKDLQRQFGVAYLFISHALSVVRHISDRVAVMYLGQIVETAPRDALFDGPRHPYTRALISAIPVPDPRLRRERLLLAGDPPSAVNPPSGCRFHTRCPFVVDDCKTVMPALLPLGGDPAHQVACHRVARGEI
jgi:peptide/nickel transport system ATP-binding protein/oligopeptide transport system ATP-binding protein